MLEVGGERGGDVEQKKNSNPEFSFSFFNLAPFYLSSSEFLKLVGAQAKWLHTLQQGEGL